MGFNIMDLMNGATRAAVEGVDNYEASLGPARFATRVAYSWAEMSLQETDLSV